MKQPAALAAAEGGGGEQEEGSTAANHLDAGALFVLKSKGSWVHCGFHLTTSIVAPALLSLPYAFVGLGWAAGVTCLALGALVSFYSYNLLSLVLEHQADIGHRHLRFRDMATHILGPRWGRYYVGPTQLVVCYGAVVGATLLGGQCLKGIYLTWHADGTMKLVHFIFIYGGLLLMLAQFPSFHSLRHINFVSLILCLLYSTCAIVGSIYIGLSPNSPKSDYSLTGDKATQTFGVFNAISIIATTFGNGIIPEIQATIAAPVKGKMLKGLCICYAVLLVTFFGVSISGYWAFGNRAEPIVFSNFSNHPGRLLPNWFLLLSNLSVILQLSAVAVVYLQPTNEILERLLSDTNAGELSTRNIIPRIIFRSISVVAATTVAAMIPFFGDLSSLLGAFGFLPLDFVLPMIFYNSTFRERRTYWLNLGIAGLFSVLAVVGCVASLRQIAVDAKTYRLFADI